MIDPTEKLTRRTLVRYGGAAFAGLSGADSLIRAASALAHPLRVPDSLPDPTRPAGTVDESLPFDHIVVVMMENHSFDNLLGALAHSGQPKAHGLKINGKGIARNRNPGAEGPVRSFPFTTTAQGGDVEPELERHPRTDRRRPDGRLRRVDRPTQPMGYWTEALLPFAYSFARTFTIANRWFCSAPCQTYPNRRFLMAGTAYGNISTDIESLKDPPPPNGTICDRLHAYGVSWRNYFTDLPPTGIIPSMIEKYPANLAPNAQFLPTARPARCPSVSFVDPEFGVLGEVGSALSTVPGWKRSATSSKRPAATRRIRRTCPTASTGPIRR